MPKAKEVTNHPCHLLSLPSAKRFWCRHCMSVFEDAITRWRHSRSCRYGVVNNFMKRRELEAKALQNTTVLNPVEARVEQSIQMADLATGARTVHVKDENGIEILTTPEDFTCFICHKKFQSMDEMRHHVKYPCNASKIVTSRVPHPKNSVPVFIESMPARHSWDQTQGLEIHQPVTSYMQEPGQSQQQHVLEQHLQAGGSVEVHMQDSGGEHCYTNQAVSYDADVGTSALPSDQEEHKNLTPTTIYVNEKGETVIEVENLDLGSDGGELSLAHLLTQLSQQGIVFDKSRSGPLQAQDFVLESSREQQQPATTHMYEVETQDHVSVGMQPDDSQVGSETLAENESLVETPIKEEDEEEGQPTAEDAANTLAQLAGFRGFIQKQHQDTGGPSTAFHQGQGQTQTVEMLQLAESESESAGVQTYQYGNPVTIQYTYPTSQSVAVVGDQSAHQEVAQSQHHHHHHIVGAQHMTLQEVLTAGSATQLYIEAESESEGSVKPGTVSGLESVRYIVDPVTGHQVVQHIDEGSRDDSSQDGCLTRDLESSAEPAGDEVVYVSAQADGTTLDHVSGETCTEDVPRHAAIVASESDTPHADMDFNSAAGEFTSIAVSTSGEEDLVPMEVDHEQPSEQDEIVDNARTENTFPVEQAVTYQDQTENDNVDVSLHTQAAVTSLDDQAAETASEQVTHCVSSISNTEGQTTGETDHAVVQLVNADDGSDPRIAGNSSNLCITDYQDTTPQDNTEDIDDSGVQGEPTALVMQSGPETQTQEASENHAVGCHDLEEDIPVIPVGVAPAPVTSVSVVGLSTSTYPGHSAGAELGAGSASDSGSESDQVGRNTCTAVQSEDHAMVEAEPGNQQDNTARPTVSMGEVADTAETVPVVDQQPVSGTGSGVSVVGGAVHQEIVELSEQTTMSTVYVVTSTGIQPVTTSSS